MIVAAAMGSTGGIVTAQAMLWGLAIEKTRNPSRPVNGRTSATPEIPTIATMRMMSRRLSILSRYGRGAALLTAAIVVPSVATCANHLRTGTDRIRDTIAFAHGAFPERSIISNRSKHRKLRVPSVARRPEKANHLNAPHSPRFTSSGRVGQE